MSSVLNAVAAAVNFNTYLKNAALPEENKFSGVITSAHSTLMTGFSLISGTVLGAGMTQATMKVAQSILNANTRLDPDRKRIIGNTLGALIAMGVIDSTHALMQPNAFYITLQSSAAIWPTFIASLEGAIGEYQPDNIEQMLAVTAGTIPGSFITLSLLLGGYSFVASTVAGSLVAYQISKRFVRDEEPLPIHNI